MLSLGELEKSFITLGPGRRLPGQGFLQRDPYDEY